MFRLPQVYLFNIGINEPFKLFDYDKNITLQCPVCFGMCDNSNHQFRKLGKALDVKTLQNPIPLTRITSIVDSNQWFDDISYQLTEMKKSLYSVWGDDIYQLNVNFFVVCKDWQNGTIESGFLGMIGAADDSYIDDRFYEHLYSETERRYAKLSAFW
jgi:hypothetical protein